MEKKKKRIVYLKSSWPNNIGNAFIDLGCIASLLQANKEINIIPVSAYPMFLASNIKAYKYNQLLSLLPSSLKLTLSRYISKHLDKLHEAYYRNVNITNNIINLFSAIKADYVVFAGNVLTIQFFKIFKPILSRLKDTRVIFYGCGGVTYSDLEIEEVRKQLAEIQPYALISRDNIAFQNYKDLAKHSFNGIDCGFFVNDLLPEVEIDLPPYAVLTFDSIENISIRVKLEQELSEKYEIVVLCSHATVPWMPLLGAPNIFNKKYFLISDSPFDYLFLYSKAKEVHSDRVHACVATLSFGNPCKLYARTPRAELFKMVGADGITKHLTFPNVKQIEKMKRRQLDFLSTIL